MDDQTFFYGTVAGLLVGAVATFLLEIVRFRLGKRWEKRLEAYERLIQALRHSRDFWAYEADIQTNRQTCDEVRYQQLQHQEREARQLVGFALAGGFLVLKRPVHDLLQDFFGQVWVTDSIDNALLRADKMKELSATYLHKLIQLAESDVVPLRFLF